MHERRLATYLNDRHAILVAGNELAGRARASNEGTVYGPALERIERDLDADRTLLRGIMQAHDVTPDRLKSGAAWVGEKLGRLKPNDQLRGYSPLSRMVELDALTAVITALDGMWTALPEVLPELRDDVAGAHERARRNLDELDTLRPQALRETLLG
jgi:hypothetical protein